MDAQSATNTAVGEVAMDEECWFSDGNIVIIAGGDYCLSRAEAESETMYGCPVVRVTDPPQGFRVFLSLVLKPDFVTLFRSPLSATPSPTLSFATLATTIRIAHKYQMDNVLEPAIARLVQFFAPGDSWADLQMSHTKRWELWRRRSNLEVEPEDSIEAVEIFRLVDKTECLPFALYICCLCGPAVLRDGVKRQDGTIMRLSDEDFARCIQGSLALSKECHIIVQRALETVENQFYNISETCTAEQNRCKESFKQMAKVHAVNRTIYPLCDVFVPIDCRNPLPSPYNSWKNPLCNSCSRWLRTSSTTLCKDLFLELPKFLGLSPLMVLKSPTKYLGMK
ncbi:hypothetical protein LXA43DRAFT_1093873 [Ganoderma leucocontextum]|nr:hypothetical protein LXA43DRAFT_1093873 [Ganoderma leucocontextum]